MFENKEKAKQGRRPDFIAREGVSVWTNEDKNGKPYLSVKIPLLNINVNAFKVEDAVSDD